MLELGRASCRLTRSGRVRYDSRLTERKTTDEGGFRRMDAVLLPGMIFLAEMCVVTLGTLRIIFVSRGQKFLAPCLGFFEVIIWLFAISQVMQHLQNAWCFLAFAAGFTIGNFLGILIEKALAMGLAQVSIVA